MVKPRERRLPVSVTVSTPGHEDPDRAQEFVPTLPWFVAAVLGGFGAVLLGWLAVGVVAAAAWLTATHLAITSLLEVVGQGWLASLGARAHLGNLSITLVPLGLTALSAAGVAAAAHWAGLQVEAEQPRWRTLAALVATTGGSYALGALVLASLVGTPSQTTSAVVGALAVGVAGAVVGGVRGLGFDVLAALPAWVRGLPGAIGLGVGVLAAGSALALAVGLVQRWPEAQALHQGLAPDAVGAVLLVLLYVCWLPTMLLWAGSYVLGAGINVGVGTLVVPGSSVLGVLPAFPPLAALPPGGTPLDWGWLAFGVAAGGASGWWFCRRDAARGGAPRWTRWSWQAALAGLGAALVWLAASWLARGDLGTGRLVGLGPVFPELLPFALVPLVVGAAVAGTATAIVATRRTRRTRPEPAEETTESVPVLVGAAASGDGASGDGAASPE